MGIIVKILEKMDWKFENGAKKILKFSHSSQNSIWDCYGSFDEQWLFSVKFARFRNFFDFAQIWAFLESDKLWEIHCWRVADGKDESWLICVVITTFGIATYCKVIFLIAVGPS